MNGRLERPPDVTPWFAPTRSGALVSEVTRIHEAARRQRRKIP